MNSHLKSSVEIHFVHSFTKHDKKKLAHHLKILLNLSRHFHFVVSKSTPPTVIPQLLRPYGPPVDTKGSLPQTPWPEFQPIAEQDFHHAHIWRFLPVFISNSNTGFLLWPYKAFSFGNRLSWAVLLLLSALAGRGIIRPAWLLLLWWPTHLDCRGINTRLPLPCLQSWQLQHLPR